MILQPNSEQRKHAAEVNLGVKGRGEGSRLARVRVAVERVTEIACVYRHYGCGQQVLLGGVTVTVTALGSSGAVVF